MKKISGFISLLLAVLFILTACTTSEPEIVPEYDAGVESANLDGLSILWGWDNVEDVTFGFIPGTAHSDMALEREKNVEKSLNCNIEMEYTSGVYDNLRASIMSGSPRYDLLTGNTYALVLDVRAGYLNGLSGLLDVSNTEKWGTPNMLQSLLWDDDLYGVVPFAWPDLLYTSFTAAIVVNEDLISRFGHEDPREYVEDGIWNWDKFEEVLHAYTVKDGERTYYGMTTHPPYYSFCMFLSNGVTFTGKKDNDVICGLYTDAGKEAMERAQKIKRETCADCFAPAESNADVNATFLNGDAFMIVSGSGDIIGDTDTWMYKMSNLGIIPFPQGPNAIPGVYSTYHEGLSFATCIPANAKEPESIAMILSAMFEPFDEYKTKEDIINYMADQIFFDRRDAAIFANMVRNTEYGFFREGGRGVIESVVASNDTVTEILAANEDKYQQMFEEYIAHHHQGRIAVYGE